MPLSLEADVMLRSLLQAPGFSFWRYDTAKYGLLVDARGFTALPLPSTAFRDVVRRIVEAAGVGFDDRVFAELERHLQQDESYFALSQAVNKHVRAAIKSLQCIAKDVANGHVTASELALVGAELKRVFVAVDTRTRERDVKNH